MKRFLLTSIACLGAIMNLFVWGQLTGFSTAMAAEGGGAVQLSIQIGPTVYEIFTVAYVVITIAYLVNALIAFYERGGILPNLMLGLFALIICAIATLIIHWKQQYLAENLNFGYGPWIKVSTVADWISLIGGGVLFAIATICTWREFHLK